MKNRPRSAEMAKLVDDQSHRGVFAWVGPVLVTGADRLVQSSAVGEPRKKLTLLLVVGDQKK